MFARKKARRRNPQIQRKGSSGFAEGLNTLAHPSTLKDTELSELINGIYSQYGSISKRGGTTVIGDTAADATKILNLTATYNIAGADRFIRISDNGKPEVYNYNTGVWDLLTATEPDGYSGDNPAFTDGTPTFDTTSITWVVQIGTRIYFANRVNDLIYLDEDGWHIYTFLADPTVKAQIAKTGSGTGTTRYFYQYVWHTEGGTTTASLPGDPDVDSEGDGWIEAMPIILDEDTYLTITLPTAPPGATRVSIFKSVNTFGTSFYMDTVDATQTTYVDKGQVETDTFYGVPSSNTTLGYHFRLLEAYGGSLVGVTEELGGSTLVWSGAITAANIEAYGSFGLDDGAGFFAYHPGDGKSINALKAHVASGEASLFVFKDDVFGKFEYVADADVGGLIKDVNISVGSMSPLSPHVAGNNLRFWSRDGAATVGNEANYGTILRYSVLSLRADAIVNRVTWANLDKVSGIYYRSLSLFGIPTGVAGAGNNAILAFDERYNAWSLWTGVYPQVFAKNIHPVTKEEQLFYGSSITADVLQMFQGKKDYVGRETATPITLSLSTKQYDMGVPDQFKKFDKVVLVFGDLVGNSTTVGITKADQRGIKSDPRLRVAQDSINSGFGNDEWGNQEFGEMTTETEGSSVNIRYVNLRQKDMFWVKLNLQNDGSEDELSLIGVYLYYAQSNRPLTFNMKLNKLASSQ